MLHLFKKNFSSLFKVMFIVIHSYKFFIHIIQLRFYDSLTYKVGIGSDKSSPLREVTSWWLWYIKKQLLKASLCLSATLNPQLAHKKAICSTQMAFSRYDLELRLFRQFQFFSTRIDVLPRLTMIFFYWPKMLDQNILLPISKYYSYIQQYFTEQIQRFRYWKIVQFKFLSSKSSNSIV